MIGRTNWLELVLHVDGRSEYSDVGEHHHRVDWLSRTTSFVSLAMVGFVVVAAALGIAKSRPAVAEATKALRVRVESAQAAGAAAEREFRLARERLRETQDAVRPDVGGELTSQLDVQANASAYIGLRGPGIELTLENSEKPLFNGTTDLGQVIDRDLQHVVNGLWRAGAEGVAINGIRLTGRASIRNAGRTILVDYRPVTAPYRIVAVGDADVVLKRFKQTAEWTELESLRDRYRIRWAIAAVPRVQLAAGASTLPNLATAGGSS